MSAAPRVKRACAVYQTEDHPVMPTNAIRPAAGVEAALFLHDIFPDSISKPIFTGARQ
jgi:hypothetical protein